MNQKLREGSLGVIYVKTHRDSIEDEQRVYKEIDATVKSDWLWVEVDGDRIPDLSQCLNLGIQACIAQGVEYIHWCHGDFTYSDPNWFIYLRNLLRAYPLILKACADNSRDPLGDFRIGQQQSWLMRSSDFEKLPWLFFDERYLRCGGAEDYAQSLNILCRTLLVVIDPCCTVYHKGAQTRSKYDTNQHQLLNQGTFVKTTGFTGLVEVHDKKYFGCLWGDSELKTLIGMHPPELRKALGLENWACDPNRIRLPYERKELFERNIFPFRNGKSNQDNQNQKEGSS